MRIAQAGESAPPSNGAAPSTPGSQINLRVAATDGLNLRSGPGLGNPIMATLSYGAALRSFGEGTRRDGYDWLPVADMTTGRTGYVAGEYCTVV